MPLSRRQIVGVALWQAPQNERTRVSKRSLVKHGMALAPLKLGIGTTVRLVAALTVSEERHLVVMGARRHWSLYRSTQQQSSAGTSD